MMKEIRRLNHIYATYSNLDEYDLSKLLNDFEGSVTCDQLLEYILDWLPKEYKEALEYFTVYEFKIYLEERYDIRFHERITYHCYISDEINKKSN